MERYKECNGCLFFELNGFQDMGCNLDTCKLYRFVTGEKYTYNDILDKEITIGECPLLKKIKIEK